MDSAMKKYMEAYIYTMETLPGKIARIMTKIHEVDIERTKIARQIDQALQAYQINVSSVLILASVNTLLNFSNCILLFSQSSQLEKAQKRSF